MLWRCEFLYSFGDREPLVTFWLQGTLGCTASHRGYVLAKTESVLWLFFGFVVGFPRFTEIMGILEVPKQNGYMKPYETI
jgi:hypothetical protein